MTVFERQRALLYSALEVRETLCIVLMHQRFFLQSKKRTQKFYYRNYLSITTHRAGNLVCVRKNDQGKYVVYANGTNYDQFCEYTSS